VSQRCNGLRQQSITATYAKCVPFDPQDATLKVARTTGIRSCGSAISAFGAVVMRTRPRSQNDNQLSQTGEITAGIASRIGGRLLHEVSEALPPTIFFFVGFNFIVLTTAVRSKSE
jgi:hypothetical protein